MRAYLWLLLAVCCGEASSTCPVCHKENCPNNTLEQCPLGLVTDLCKCCPLGVCARTEGERCYDPNLLPQLGPQLKYSFCGENLLCQLRADLSPTDEPEGLCVCVEHQLACASDNKTYSSICHLELEAAKRGYNASLFIQQWGPCWFAPELVTGPQDVTSSLNQPVALDCEVRGYPVPAITWVFTAEDGSVRTLPGDDLSIVVQLRGGPELLMTTSWLQVAALRSTDTGLYVCMATNKHGTVHATATVAIRQEW